MRDRMGFCGNKDFGDLKTRRGPRHTETNYGFGSVALTHRKNPPSGGKIKSNHNLPLSLNFLLRKRLHAVGLYGAGLGRVGERQTVLALVDLLPCGVVLGHQAADIFLLRL